MFRGPLQGGNRIGVEVLHLTGGRIQDVDCPSLNKWDRRSDYLVESFVRRYHATRRAVSSANDVSQGPLLNLFSLRQYRFPAPEVDIGWRQIFQALRVSLVVVVIDERLSLLFKITA